MDHRALIRPATPADLPSLLDRWRELMRYHQGLDPELYALTHSGERTYRAFVRRMIDNHDGLVLVAPGGPDTATHADPGATSSFRLDLDASPPDRPSRPGHLAGYLVGGLGQRAPMFRVRAVGMIHDLAVHPDHRRRGIGRALVDAALDHFRQRGLDHIQVDWDPQNPAATAFWTTLGFAPRLTEAYRKL